MELYFTTYLTENEHGYVHSDILKYCKEHTLVLVYYRPFKTGHVPCQRECKIAGLNRKKLAEFKDWCLNTSITPQNYWREQKL